MVSSATSQLSLTAATSSSMNVLRSASAFSPPIAPSASAAFGHKRPFRSACNERGGGGVRSRAYKRQHRTELPTTAVTNCRFVEPSGSSSVSDPGSPCNFRSSLLFFISGSENHYIPLPPSPCEYGHVVDFHRTNGNQGESSITVRVSRGNANLSAVRHKISHELP